MSAYRSRSALGRRALLGGIGAGVIAASLGVEGTAFAQVEPTDKDFTKLRFVSYNVHHAASPDDVVDLERIARLIERLDPDVIALQEVDRFWARSDYVDQPAWFGERLGMHVIFGANFLPGPEEPGRPDREYGTATLSKWPITAWENIYLPRFDDHEQRGLLRADITAGDTRFSFNNTHLQFDNDPEREAQAAKIVEIFGAQPQRTILAGDMNTTDDTVAHEILTSPPMLDAWQEVGEGPGYTYHSTDPTTRIDYLFGSPDSPVERIEVDLDDPLASDHLPVVGDYWVPKGR